MKNAIRVNYVFTQPRPEAGIDVVAKRTFEYSLEIPAAYRLRNISKEIDPADIEECWRENGRVAHHAPYDAGARTNMLLIKRLTELRPE
jgi:hypothetical protein